MKLGFYYGSINESSLSCINSQGCILPRDPRPLQRLRPQPLLRLLVQALRRTGVPLEKGKVPPLTRMRRIRRQVDHIDPGLGGGAHRRVCHQPEKRLQRLDDELGQ